MSINLDFDSVNHSVRVAVARQLAIWGRGSSDLPDKLSVMITETIFDVAATARTDGTEKAVMEGLKMLRNWED